MNMARPLASAALLALAIGIGACREDGSAKVGGKARTTVRFSYDAIGKGGTLARELCQEFEAKTGIRVEAVGSTASASERLLLTRQMLGSRSSQVDVYMIDVIWPPILAENLSDLTATFIAEASSFVPENIAANTVARRLVAAPWYCDVGLLYYRQDLLEKYGYAKPPATWSELEAMSRTIQEGERAAGNPAFWGYAIAAEPGENLTCMALEWQVSEGGGSLVDEAGRPTVDNAKAAAALDRAAAWIGSIVSPASLAHDLEESRAEFQRGNAAFLRSWTYAWVPLNEAGSPVAGKVAIGAIPAGSDRHAAVLGGWQLGVAASSPHPTAAADLVKFLVSEEAQRRRAIEGGFAPTRLALYEDAAVAAAQPHLPRLRESLKGAVARPARQFGERYAEVSALYFRIVHATLSGRQTGAQAVKEIDAGIRELLPPEN